MHPGKKIFFVFSILLLVVVIIQPVVAIEKSGSIAIVPQETKIAQLYVAMLDRDIDIGLKALESTSPGSLGTLGTLPAHWPKDASGEEMDPLPMQFPKSSVLRTVELAGAMAYAYRIPQSQWHEKQEILSKIQEILQNLLDNASQEIPFSLGKETLSSEDFAHYLEPILTIHALMSDRFPVPFRHSFHNWLDRNLEAFHRNPIRKQNDQGMAWCAILAIASQATDRSQYLQSANEAFGWLVPLLDPSGEYLDPRGVDLVRTTRFLRHLFLYRLHSGRDDLDEKILPCLKWYCRLFSVRGVPLLGHETLGFEALGFEAKLTKQCQTLFAQLVGPLAWYSKQETRFSQIITRYMETLMELPAGFTLENGGGTFLRGSMYHTILDELPVIPYTPYLQLCNHTPQSHYVLVGRNYQSAILLSDPIHAKGMQVWSYRDESPVLFPSLPRYSGTIGFGYDSHRLNASANDTAAPYKIVSVSDNIDVLFVSQDGPTTAYIFTGDMVVVLHRQPFEDALLEWIQNREFCVPPAQMKGSAIQFMHSVASLLLPPESIPNFEEWETGHRFRLHFKSEYCWYTLAGPDSRSIVRPVHSGLLFIHLYESNQSMNLVVNLSSNPFTLQQNFPGTRVPIPPMDPWTATLIHSR